MSNMKNWYSENYEMLLNEMKQDTDKDIRCVNAVKMSIISK